MVWYKICGMDIQECMRMDVRILYIIV